MVNVVLAFVIFIGVLYTWGETYLPADNVKYGVTSELVFKDMGIRNGDKIVAFGRSESKTTFLISFLIFF